MQSVVRSIISVGILISLISCISGCGLNVFSSNGERYQIQVIQSVPLQEYLERFGGSGDLGIPTEIQLTQTPPDHFYKGRVKLSIAGWKNIESPSMLDDGEKSFDVSTGLDFINLWFYQLEIQDKTLSGSFQFLGPAIQAGPQSFIAIRK